MVKKMKLRPILIAYCYFKKAKERKKILCIDEAMHNNLYDYNIDKEVISFNS